jgi:hypothetical protein
MISVVIVFILCYVKTHPKDTNTLLQGTKRIRPAHLKE